jgi:hypothetical protein
MRVPHHKSPKMSFATEMQDCFDELTLTNFQSTEDSVDKAQDWARKVLTIAEQTPETGHS